MEILPPVLPPPYLPNFCGVILRIALVVGQDSDPHTSSAHMDHDPHTHFPHFKNVSYFFFFSELHASDHVAGTVVETLAILAVFLFSVAANVGAAALVTWERKQLANKTVLTINLFVADLLFVSMIPLIVAVRWSVSWRMGHKTCRAMLYVICMSGCVTLTTLASISVERVQAILRLQTTPTLNPRSIGATLTFIWVFSMLTCMPISLFFTVVEVQIPHQESLHICTLKWPDQIEEIVWNVAVTTLCFLLPGLIIVVSYSKILQITKSCLRRVRPRGRGGDSPQYQVSRQDIKLFRTLLVLVLSFLIMWSPVFIITFLILARSFLPHLFVSPTLFFWVVTFTMANSALNPILYAVCASSGAAGGGSAGAEHRGGLSDDDPVTPPHAPVPAGIRSTQPRVNKRL